MTFYEFIKSDNHIKGTSEHTKRLDLMICLGKKFNPTPMMFIIRENIGRAPFGKIATMQQQWKAITTRFNV